MPDCGSRRAEEGEASGRGGRGESFLAEPHLVNQGKAFGWRTELRWRHCATRIRPLWGSGAEPSGKGGR